MLFAILQKYDFSSKSQPQCATSSKQLSCLRYCKSTIFQANHNAARPIICKQLLFAILQKYDFSSKSQQILPLYIKLYSCLRYCKSTIFQANHNFIALTAFLNMLFAILQKYDFSSKSQQNVRNVALSYSCLRYCKSTIFQANHNYHSVYYFLSDVVCDTAKVRFFKQITT